MEIGRLVEFFDDQKHICGVITGVKGRKLNVLVPMGTEKSINTSRIIHVSSESIDTSLPVKHLTAYLKEHSDRRDAIGAEINLRELWETITGEDSESDPQLLAELWFGSSVSNDQVAAMVRLLFRDKIYFAKKENGFVPHTMEEVEKNLQRLQRAQEREQNLQNIVLWLEAILDEREPEAVPANKEEIIELLKEVAIFEEEAPNLKRAREILDRLSSNAPQIPFQILVALGVWSEHEFVYLHTLQVNQEWKPELITEALRVKEQNQTAFTHAKESGRRDLTQLPLFTIDGEFTTDIDDAIHIIPTQSGLYEIGIHISDVAAFIHPNSPLDIEAMERATSIYLPERKIPMIPPVLSEDTLSLIAGQDRLAISILVLVRDDGAIISSDILPSIIKVGRRLSYEWANEHMNEMPELGLLDSLTKAFRQERISRGAILQNKPEIELFVDEKYTITMKYFKEQGATQAIISELMILANSLFASFLNEHSIPALFRTQSPPLEPIQSMPKFDPVKHYRMRKLMSKADITTEPGPHTGLGLEMYTTATSPIRRYVDLIAQRQIRAALQLEPAVLSTQELLMIMGRLEPVIQQANYVEYLRFRYWLYKYLESLTDCRRNAIVLEQIHNKVRVLIPDFMIEFEIPVGLSRTFTPGQQVTVVIEHVSAINNRLYLRIID